MSRVLLGRATRCVGAAAAAATFLCCAGPSLGKSSPGISAEGSNPSGPVPVGVGSDLASVATEVGSVAPPASASSACAYENASVRRASPDELRSAAICLINHFRGRGGLPRLHQQGQLDAAAQSHDDQMVTDHYFAHTGIGGSTPGLRISAAGFSWGAYGEAISTGFRTPRQAISSWLRSAEHCRILLSPQYRYIGLGVNPRPVGGWTRRPGTWTADLALPLGWAAPSRNWGLADHCPY